MIVIVSGSSGVGKNTVINRILQQNDDFLLMQTLTTRSKRPGERDGMPYYFVNDETFRRKINDGEFYEYENVHGHFYGTSRRVLADRLSQGKILLKDIDVHGTMNLQSAIGCELDLLTIFLYVEKEVLIERLTGRGEKEIGLRLKRYDEEFSYIANYDYIITNRDLAQTADCMTALARKSVATFCLPCAESEITECQQNMTENEVKRPVKASFIKQGIFIAEKDCVRYLAAKRQGTRLAVWLESTQPARLQDYIKV